ncbi:translation initiation factor eIF4E [Bonamia ostreae]|uniref:Translation initiation factor eIF4E n=1 Tax=Bonamia ostreae TaxID=126728 RepID=A0ABV2AF63_9EUKA
MSDSDSQISLDEELSNEQSKTAEDGENIVLEKNAKTTQDGHSKDAIEKPFWAFWYNSGKTPVVENNHSITEEEWMSALLKVRTFKLYKEYFEIENVFRPASEIARRSSYYFFREGITPTWEDKNNANGGRWFFSIRRENKEDIDKTWRLLIASFFAGAVKHMEDVCGAVVSSKNREYRVSLWVRNNISISDQHELGSSIKKILGVKSEVILKVFN